MPTTLPTTIPEDKIPSHDLKELSGKVSYKLIKVFTSDDEEISLDVCKSKSHTQLFYNVTKNSDLSKCNPSYIREVYRPNPKIENLYWYDEALKSAPSSSNKARTLWTIEQIKAKKPKLFKKVKRPRVFSISNTELESNSVFEYGGSKTEPKGYSCEVLTPFDNSSIQRYRWVRHKDGSRWAFIARNDPNTSLVELRKTSSKNEFDIVFLEPSPAGWSKEDSSTYFDQPISFTGRYPSLFSNPSTYRSSASSRFLSNRGSSLSDVSDTNRDSRNSNVSHVKNSKTFSTYLKNLDENPSDFEDSERNWQEFVLASTVTIQEEVNSNKRRLWRKK